MGKACSCLVFSKWALSICTNGNKDKSGKFCRNGPNNMVLYSVKKILPLARRGAWSYPVPTQSPVASPHQLTRAVCCRSRRGSCAVLPASMGSGSSAGGGGTAQGSVLPVLPTSTVRGDRPWHAGCSHRWWCASLKHQRTWGKRGRITITLSLVSDVTEMSNQNCLPTLSASLVYGNRPRAAARLCHKLVITGCLWGTSLWASSLSNLF